MCICYVYMYVDVSGLIGISYPQHENPKPKFTQKMVNLIKNNFKEY